jgi:hypothetical protein
MRSLLKVGGSFMADLTAARAVIERSIATPEILAVMIGTGYPFEWYSERFSAVDRKIKGVDRIRVSAACQTANEVVLSIFDERLRLTTPETLREQRPPDVMQLLQVAEFLEGQLATPIGSDCKALRIAEALGWDAVALAKRRDDLPRTGPLSMAVVRERYPKLIDRGFEDMWPHTLRVFVVPALECIPSNQPLLDVALELVK